MFNFDFKDVSEWEFDIFEQLGTKEKHWLINPDTHEKWLFKKERENSRNDLAEVLASHIASLLNIPHAEYILARENGIKGVITKNMVPDGGRLVHGNELIFQANNIDKNVLRKKESLRRHNIPRISFFCEQVNAPKGWVLPNGVDSAVGVFLSYLMLDCLIANQDRHYENWGIILNKDSSLHLAPSFDHASSLATTESHRNMLDRLSTKDKNRSMDTFISRAKTQIYSKNGSRRLLTIDAFRNMAEKTPEEANAWLQKLTDIEYSRISSIFDCIPDSLITATEVDFYKKIVELNFSRLIKVRDEL